MIRSVIIRFENVLHLPANTISVLEGTLKWLEKKAFFDETRA